MVWTAETGITRYAGKATIQLTEASDELRHYCERLDLDPNRLFELEQRIAKQISLARKHHVSPESAAAALSVTALEEQQQLDDQAVAGNADAGGCKHHQQALETAQKRCINSVSLRRSWGG